MKGRERESRGRGGVSIARERGRADRERQRRAVRRVEMTAEENRRLEVARGVASAELVRAVGSLFGRRRIAAAARAHRVVNVGWGLRGERLPGRLRATTNSGGSAWGWSGGSTTDGGVVERETGKRGEKLRQLSEGKDRGRARPKGRRGGGGGLVPREEGFEGRRRGEGLLRFPNRERGDE